MPVAPATIVRTNRSCPGTSTTDSRRPSGQLERRVAEVDRDPAPLLLGKPVRVLAGQRPHEPRLAVVDVPRGADRQRHRSSAEPRTAQLDGRRRATSSTSASASVRQSRSVRPSRTTAITGGSPAPQRLGERLLDRARGARQLRERKRAAADARDRLLDLAADERREPLRPRPHLLERLVEHAQHRHLVARRRVERERERSLERGERELVGAQRALERVAAQPLDELGAPDDDARLRPAEELVAREADEVGAGARGSAPGSARRRRERARPSRGRRRAGGRLAARSRRAPRAAAAR